MAKALYYDENLKPKAFDVIKDNKDGTVDIGNGKTLVVGKAKVVDVPAAGSVTLGVEVPEVPAETIKPATKPTE